MTEVPEGKSPAPGRVAHPLDLPVMAALGAYMHATDGQAVATLFADFREETPADWRAVADAVRMALGLAAPSPAPASGMLDLYREALERLADEDTPVLGGGLGGGAQEELHVRASFAAHALGRDTCGCTECMVSLGLEPDIGSFDEDAQRAADLQAHVSGTGGPHPSWVTGDAAGVAAEQDRQDAQHAFDMMAEDGDFDRCEPTP